MKVNPWKRLVADVLPGTREMIGDVFAFNSDGTSTIDTLDGRVIKARGQTVAIGLRAFVNDGKVTGQAPNLPSITQTV